MRDYRGRFQKGSEPHNLKWSYESIHQNLKNVIQEFHNKTGFVPVFTILTKHPKYKTAAGALKRSNYKSLEVYKQILDELGFDYPEKTSGYYIDGGVCTGFYEFAAHCFAKAWGVKITLHPKVFENFVGDGYLDDYNFFWEHWGGLNKKNDYKLNQYKKLGMNLLSTFDHQCQNKGIIWWYYEFKQKLQEIGVQIEFDEPEGFDPVDLLHGKVLTLKDVYINVKEQFGDENPRLNNLRNSNRYQVLHYFGKFSSFISYCNKNFGESWVYQEKDLNLTDVTYCVELLKPLIIKLKRFPTDREMKGLLKNVSRAIIKHHGGLENFKKNLYDEGEYFYLVQNILGFNTPTTDRLYDFRDHGLFEWSVHYITKKFGGQFPKYYSHLKNNFDDDVCKFFYFALRPNSNMTKYNSWSEFMIDYFGDYSSESKKFKSKLSYDDYKNTRLLIECQKYELKIISRDTNLSTATLNRILQNDSRFLDYHLTFINEFPQFTNSKVIGDNRISNKFSSGLSYDEKRQIAKLTTKISERKLAGLFNVNRGIIISIKKNIHLYQ